MFVFPFRPKTVDYRTRKLKHRFVSFEEHEGHGPEVQIDCLVRSMASLFPHEEGITKENIADLILQKHTIEIQVQKEKIDYQNPLNVR